VSAYTTARFHDGERYLCVLAREGHKLTHLTFISELGIVHRAVDREDGRYLRPLLRKGSPYPVSRMVSKFRDIGRARGITEAAKEELRRASC
jgi:hypothetical protein